MEVTLKLSFVNVLSTNEIKPGQMKGVEAGNKKILVVNLIGKFYAIGDVCMHSGCSLSEGTLVGENVECPCHGSTYDVKTGNVIEGPATKPEPTFDVKTEGNRVFIKV